MASTAGRGIKIIKGLMDDVNIESQNGGHAGHDAEAADALPGRVSTSAEIAVERRGGTLVAHVTGEVDMTNAGHVRDQLLDSVPNDALGLVIDLHECRYLDSAGIEVIFDIARRLRRRRQELRIVVPSGSPLTRVLELTEVGTAAPIHETVDAAVGG